MEHTHPSVELPQQWEPLTEPTIAKLEPDQVLKQLATDAHGLSSAEAAARLQQVGYANLAVHPTWTSVVRLLAIILRPLLVPLWIAAAIAFGLDKDRTGQALVAAATLNTIVAAVQERKVERSTAALHDALPSFARVLRDGREQHIMTSMLVPGDVLLLRPNDALAADARVIEADHLHMVDAILEPDQPSTHKHAEPVEDDDATAIERANIVYAGSRVVSGHGQAVVFATGIQTAFGKIAALTQRAHQEPSPLLLAFTRLGNIVLATGILAAIGGYAYVVTILELSTRQALEVAILFLTAAVPAGLMPGVTLTLIEGAQRLQRRNAIFRRLSNVETLGATTVICADTTGTLTQNEMTARELWTTEGPLAVSGVGYQPQGAFNVGQRVLDTATVQQRIAPLLRAAVVTSTARVLPPDTLRPQWHILGDPIEAAHIVVAAKAGIRATDVYEQLPQLAILDNDHRLPINGVIVNEHDHPMLYVKGTPNEILRRCQSIMTTTGERPIKDRDRQTITQMLHRYEQDAMRTVAFARKKLANADVSRAEVGQAEQLVFLGLIAVLDPPRQDVAEAIEACHDAKIRTIMLTADDTIGATSIARRCTMVQDARPTVISGPQLETIDRAQLKERLREGDIVLARLTPEHKVRVVETLEELGEVVLVTGGAASDVPALKAAYTSIAMGETGSPAANQTADLVLLDDNFATVAVAIAEGRAVEQRVRRLVALNLATTVVKLAALIVALVTGLPLLLTVGQQLLIDFLGGLLPGIAVGAGRPDPRLMQRPPRPTGRPLLARKVYLLGYVWFGGLAATLALVTSVLYIWQNRNRTTDFPDLLIGTLQPYSERIGSFVGQLGLNATTLYVVISVAALLGAALIRRSTAPGDRAPLLLSLTMVGLSFILLIAIILVPAVHPYVALTTIPFWDWPIAFGVMILVAGLELLRQRLDPIFPPAAKVSAATPQITSVRKR